MRTVMEVEESTDQDHLYLMVASQFLENMVKIGRSHHPQERACALQSAMPFHLKVVLVYYGCGYREHEIHEALKEFRVEGVPGKEWFRLDVPTAYQEIGKVLFAPET